MSQYASKDDMIGAMRKRIAELESELEAVGAGGVNGPLIGQPQRFWLCAGSYVFCSSHGCLWSQAVLASQLRLLVVKVLGAVLDHVSDRRAGRPRGWW